jgi:hypothetical protein
MKRSDLWCLTGVIVAATPARAQPIIETGSVSSWLHALFHFGAPMALDYILLAIGPIVGAVVGVFYYRSALYDAVMQMQRPASVKLRAAGLGLVIAGLILMMAPHLAAGWLAVLVLIGIVLAAVYGLAVFLVAGLAIAVVALIAAKLMNWI